MKKIALLVATLMVAAVTLSINSATAQNAQKWVVGPKLNIYSRWNGTVGIGAFARYGIIENFRAEAAFAILCRRGASVDISLDAQYAFSLSNRLELYPIAGLSFNDCGVASLGINLGGGADYAISNRISVNTSIKYMIETAKYARNPLIFSFGCGYRF